MLLDVKLVGDGALLRSSSRTFLISQHRVKNWNRPENVIRRFRQPVNPKRQKSCEVARFYVSRLDSGRALRPSYESSARAILRSQRRFETTPSLSSRGTGGIRGGTTLKIQESGLAAMVGCFSALQDGDVALL